GRPASEDLIKRPGELAVPIPHQEPNRAPGSRPLPSEIPRLLSDPGGVGVRRAAPEVYLPTLQLDEEEHVQHLQPYCLHREEVTGDDARGPLAQECSPA